MVIRPERNNAQFQPLTIVLRNIIKEYPAGGGVLRELCQNADDAGASEIEFVLDRRQHPTEGILHEGLAEFQGASLLSFNNSAFTKVDFESLSRIGDSAKAKDLSSTGKFGRGFNSVYNWTDSPSILSGSSLLILDPHQTWSPEVGQPGGPVYNFVEYSQEPEMRNQLAAFSSITTDFDSEFHGTIIRLPLRTESQAVKTNILPPEKLKPTLDMEIIESFRRFTEEMVETLLFLKNLHMITLRVDDKIYSKAVSTTQSASGIPKKAKINAAYKRVFVQKTSELCAINFVMDISLYRSQTEQSDGNESHKNFKFAISHNFRQGPPDSTLEGWSRSQKLFPWVAIATPLEGYEEFKGRLFTTLPLPVYTQHPVHIHGMFSITPDRRSIHSGSDLTISDDSEASLGSKWNEWLLHECVPNTWIQNLELLRVLTERNECKFSGWNFWPTGSGRDSGELWMGILSDVFRRVTARNIELFPTICDIIGRRDDIIFALEVPRNLTSSLKQAGASIVIPPQDRRHEIERLGPYTIGLIPLEPWSARECLSNPKDPPNFENLPLTSRVVLLHYILSDESFAKIGSCTAPLIPLVDGTYASFDRSRPHVRSIFLTRDDDEARLFSKHKKIVDTSKIPSKVIKIMRKYISNGQLQHFTKISVWGKDDVVRYCMEYIFNTLDTQNTYTIHNDNLVDFINKIWEWIRRHCIPLDSIGGSRIQELFLLPTIGGEYSRLDSRIAVLDISKGRGIGAFLRETAISHLKLYGRRYDLFIGDGFSPVVSESLRTCGLLGDYGDVKNLLDWLTGNRHGFVDQLNESEKFLLLQHLNALSRSGLNDLDRRFMGDNVVYLSIFREAFSRDISERPWISINSRDTSYIGVKDVPVPLYSPNTVFIDISNPDTEQIVTRLDIVTCPRRSKLFEMFVIPNLAAVDEELRPAYVQYVLKNYHTLSPKSKDDLRRIEIVPVQCSGDKISFKCPGDTVAPNSVASSLYFSDEYREPVKEFYSSYDKILVDLGMVNTIAGDVILDRIIEYKQRGKENYPLDEIATKAQKLITNCDAPMISQDISSLRWIPAQGLDGKIGLFSALKCRDQGREMLVKYIMPLVGFSISPAWAKCFGWDLPLKKRQLLGQLQEAVNAEDSTVIEYLIDNNELGPYKIELSRMKWIPSSVSGYYAPSMIFHKNIQALSPHFGTMKTKYRGLELFKELGVQDSPSLDQFRELQDLLAEKETLEESDIDKAIFIVTEVARRCLDKKSLSSFKAPDRYGRMYPISELTAGDPGSADVKLVMLHPRFSLETAKRLGISTFRDRYLELLNDPYYEGEFAQRESPIAAIQDTLKRYPFTSTFNEYLANAEDSGSASKISWILDTADNYSKAGLLSPQLAGTQGPALFCCNDGIFTDDDFKGIINVGVGSKGGSSSKIGKFGKGALTMYHWTSVPSFISGDYYVIFDPEQKYLPEHPYTKKPRAGMKLKIQDVWEQAPDQLLPFEGISNFGKSSKSFPGTLFRFPLRRSDTSSLTQGRISIFDAKKYLENYYHEATSALLFLKKISAVSFSEKTSEGPIWSVSSAIHTHEPGITYVKINRQPPASGETYSDNWLIISSKNTEKINIPPSLVDIKKNGRLEAKYSLALPVEIPEHFCARHFVGLPLGFIANLGLPVHVNADIIIGSNRQSIPIRENEEGSAWNNWIYEEGIAPLYLDLVIHLVKYGLAAYNYWPQYPSKVLSQNTDSVTRTISAAFWKLVSSSPSTLYPALELLPDSATTNTHVQKNLSLKAAIFNFLDPADSEVILPLLTKLGVENIVTPNKIVKDGLREAQPPSLKSITPQYFLKHLCSLPAHHRSTLLNYWANEKNYSINFLNSILSFITRDRDFDLASLIGCALLPLADDTLGTFLPKNGNKNFLVAETTQEREILEISQNLTVHPNLDKAVLGRLVSPGRLNITRFTPNDIKRLCPILDEMDKGDAKDWLVKVWGYLRDYPPDLPEFQLSHLDDMPIYFGKITGESDKKLTFFCPSDFESYRYPVILKQSGITEEAASVLNLFKGLILLNRSAFPREKKKQESIKTITGLYRLLRSIDILASRSGTFIEDYITKTVPLERITALRNLFPPALFSGLLQKYISAKKYLLQFPIWPIASNQALVYRPVTKASLPPLESLSPLRITTGDIFIEANTARQYADELNYLGVKRMSVDYFLRNHVGIRQGHGISPAQKPGYPTLLQILYRENKNSFSQYPLGVDGNGKFCMLESLYSSDVQIFAAAFRDTEKARFLHPDYRNLGVWGNSPLRDTITENHYLACAYSIQRRGTGNNILDDAKTVFGYLPWDTPDKRSWNMSTWNQLSEIIFVPTLTTSPATMGHRRLRMQEISQGASLATLKQAIHPDYTNICWSQCPIFLTPPTQFVLSKTPTHGMPSIDTVLKHLIFLSKNRFKVERVQITDYIKDLKASYMYLLGYGGGTLRDIDVEIWFNVETEDIPSMSKAEFQESWKSTSNLCLRLQYDSPPLQRIRSFLTPFQELLEYSGVRKLKGIIPPPPAPKIPDHSSLALSGFQRLRSQGLLFDITLVVEDQSFQAHWPLLAAVSAYWETMAMSRMLETTTKTVTLPEMRPEILSILLDYIYTGKIPNIDFDADVTTELEGLIDLLYAADLWRLNDLKNVLEHRLCNEHWIRPETVRRVLNCAEAVHAKTVALICRRYISDNNDIVQREEEDEDID